MSGSCRVEQWCYWSQNGVCLPTPLSFNPSVISPITWTQHTRDHFPALRFATDKVGVRFCAMSDSEEDSQDRQLKIVVVGDGACGKVRTITDTQIN